VHLNNFHSRIYIYNVFKKWRYNLCLYEIYMIYYEMHKNTFNSGPTVFNSHICNNNLIGFFPRGTKWTWKKIISIHRRIIEPGCLFRSRASNLILCAVIVNGLWSSVSCEVNEKRLTKCESRARFRHSSVLTTSCKRNNYYLLTSA